MNKKNNKQTLFSRRFRGLMPVVVDVETSGLNAQTDGLLEIAAVMIEMNDTGTLKIGETHAYHVEPFHGAHLDKDALAITGIDPTMPLRFAIPEKQALERVFAAIREKLYEHQCYRAVLVGHNAWFDLSFLMAAAKRTGIYNHPFHTFTTFDTASLSAITFGETVLARATRRARIYFDIKQAHSAIYDAVKTAELFINIVNRTKFERF